MTVPTPLVNPCINNTNLPPISIYSGLLRNSNTQIADVVELLLLLLEEEEEDNDDDTLSIVDLGSSSSIIFDDTIFSILINLATCRVQPR